ncbi:glycoside hydrolase family 3 C-terminal domain-containing protein [Vibrio sp. FNV 38]|nr:glycoside hydrolase family 3 C-terminal domain-containing protein [Vibrio sp. FNV 38]
MKNTKNNVNQALATISRQIAAEGLVLLENKNNTLPLMPNEMISVFGRCQIDTYRSGTGSGGAVNVPYAVNILDGLQANRNISLNQKLVSHYQDWVRENPFDNSGGGWAAEPWFQKEMPLEADVVEQAAKSSDKAIIIIGRTAGEEQDNAEQQGSYFLTEDELNMVELVTQHFKQVVVVLNVSNIIDMSWLESVNHPQAITAVLYSWAAGMEGGHALADVLSGDVSPSGRMTDTVAHNIEDYPSTANFGRTDFNQYQEDIYVGYRYFETFKPEAVKYEFGSGLSYSEFTTELINYTTTEEDGEQVFSFDIEVINTGNKASKEVVQLYVESPQGQLGKSSRQLVAFAKTQVLAPKDSQMLTLSVPMSILAAYDDSGVSGYKSSYVLEEGKYRFYLGGSVRRAQLVNANFELEKTLCLETLTEAMAPVQAFTRIKPDVRQDNGCYNIVYEAVPTRQVDLAKRIQSQLPKALEFTGDVGIKLIDVKEQRASLSDFVSQLNDQDLASIARGEGMCSPKVTPGTAAAFGGVTERLIKFGIPVAAAADGPSGIRMDSGHNATQVPIGTLLGCSWNTDLNEELYSLVGQELRLNKIDTLLGPGINIHRHPLNGRNFEYFSEDAVLTGRIAAAQTRGLKRAGVTGTIKHFVANDQETERKNVDSIVSERALREIHLKPFEMAVKEGNATSIMTAYNPVNGHWTASNYDLNTTILRGEWGYRGIVMSDWWAKMNSPELAGEASMTRTGAMIRSQNDLYMVVDNNGSKDNVAGDDTLSELAQGNLMVGEMQRIALNICRFLLDTPAMDRPVESFDSVKMFAPIKGKSFESLISNLQQITFGSEPMINISVTEEGVYDCRALMKYDRDSTAQSSCNLSINDVFAMTLPINGTKGHMVEVVGQKVSLKKGTYQLSVESVKPGLELEYISLIRC